MISADPGTSLQKVNYCISEDKTSDNDIEDVSGPKRRKGGRYSGDGKSAVWEHFFYDLSTEKSLCYHCGHYISGKHTGDLKKHLYRNHKSVYDLVEAETDLRRPAVSIVAPKRLSTLLVSSQLTFSDFVNKTIPYCKDSQRYSDLNDAMALLFASHSLPYRLVESTEFRQFCRLLDPRFEPPSHSELSAVITDLFKTLKAKMLMEFKRIKMCVILIIWLRCGSSESYLGVIVQYFDRKTSTVKKALIALRMISSPSGENIRSMLQSIFDEWEIREENVLHYVMDNGNEVINRSERRDDRFKIVDIRFDDNNDNGCSYDQESGVSISLDCSSIESVYRDIEQFENCENDHNSTFGYSKRIPSITDQLANIVRKYVDGSLSFRPTLTAAIRLNDKINKFFQTKASRFDNNGGKVLISPSISRWFLTYDILKRLLELKLTVEKFVLERDLSDVYLTTDQWTEIYRMIDLLEPIAEGIRELESDSCCTISQVIPTIIGLIDKLNKRSSGSIETIRISLQNELKQLSTRHLNFDHPDFCPAYVLATFFDPRFVIGLSNDQRHESIEMIAMNLTSFSEVSTTVTVDATAAIEKLAKEEKYGAFFKNAQPLQIRSSVSATDSYRLIKDSLNRYIGQAIQGHINMNNNSIDPVGFWIENVDKFGEIAVYALNILRIPVSSAEIKQLYSSEFYEKRENSYNLNTDSIEMETMIKVNREYMYS